MLLRKKLFRRGPTAVQSDLGTAFEAVDRQRADAGVATGHRLIPGYRAGICWAGLHLTPQDQILIYSTTSVCVCMCVLRVCTLAQRGVRLISTTEHSSGVTFSAIPRSNQTHGYMCYLHSAGC